MPAPYRVRTPPANVLHVTLAVPFNTSNMKTLATPKKNLLQHTSETDETFGTNVCNICVKHIQHPDKTLATCV
jgi:hypothetical protein